MPTDEPALAASPSLEAVLAHAKKRGFRFEPPGASFAGIGCEELATRFGTPTYVYDLERVRGAFGQVRAAVGPDAVVCYAVKANSARVVLETLGRLGAGMDVVSGGELRRARQAGIAPDRIVFSGVGKTDDEIDLALREGILALNVESAEELWRVQARALALGTVAHVMLRLSPDYSPETHPYLATGHGASKFGLDFEEGVVLAGEAARAPGIHVRGIGCHIGSQMMDLVAFECAVDRMVEAARGLAAKGIDLELLDLGGGLGVDYEPGQAAFPLAEYARVVSRAAAETGLRLVLEPGRSIVATAGILLTRVISQKTKNRHRFVVVDAAMNDLMRPALYHAYHAIVPCTGAREVSSSRVDVVGPVCESADVLGLRRELPELARGDLLAVLDAGAYGFSMASTYNTRPLPAEGVIDAGRLHLTRPREDVSRLLAGEALPPWLVP